MATGQEAAARMLGAMVLPARQSATREPWVLAVHSLPHLAFCGRLAGHFEKCLSEESCSHLLVVWRLSGVLQAP